MQIDSLTFSQMHLILRTARYGKHGISFLALLFLLSLSIQPAGAQSGGPSSGSENDQYYNGKLGPSFGVIVVVLIVALFSMGFFSIYIRRCSEDSSVGSRYRVTGITALSRRGPRGLDAAVIQSFPMFPYSAVKSLKIGKGALECAVCLNEFEDDETLRLIPTCDHVFHPDCIDAWLTSHSTCPVCRANLIPQPGGSTHSSGTDQSRIDEHDHSQHDVVVELSQECERADSGDGGDIMERPLRATELVDVSQRLNRNRTRRNMSGRPRWLGRFSRSNSTGHVAVKQWENTERYTLRLPEEVRKQIMSGKLTRSASCVVMPAEGSSRKGFRTGEGSSRGRFGSARFDRAGRSDRWVFSLAPPFFSRAPSLRSPKVVAEGGDGGSMHLPKTVTFDVVPTSKVDTATATTLKAATELPLPPV
ncbi:hypothetical protein Nepgr_009609 [Nepenthes gracilis]|uniref:RING-type E3 ubiquitin transferase n=1 Tax=Nepenthes gracilis TaxID=150966 RepID=A0AAD3XKI0_NEPGR|nr:hypothetical protein Nepgr_009609 [Nepenthes gracilis]